MEHVWTGSEDIPWERWYRGDDDAYPGVTSILNATGGGFDGAHWIGKVGERWARAWSNSARDNGIDLHDHVERYFKGETDLAHPWLGDNARKFLFGLATEHAQPELRIRYKDGNIRYAGTADLVTEDAVYDWKTHRKHVTPKRKPDQHLQLAAYAHALNKPEAHIITFLPEDVHYDFPVDLADAWPKFMERCEQYWGTDAAKTRYDQAMKKRPFKATEDQLNDLLDAMNAIMPTAANERGIWTARFFDVAGFDRGSPSSDDVERAMGILRNGYGA